MEQIKFVKRSSGHYDVKVNGERWGSIEGDQITGRWRAWKLIGGQRGYGQRSASRWFYGLQAAKNAVEDAILDGAPLYEARLRARDDERCSACPNAESLAVVRWRGSLRCVRCVERRAYADGVYDGRLRERRERARAERRGG